MHCTLPQHLRVPIYTELNFCRSDGLPSPLNTATLSSPHKNCTLPLMAVKIWQKGSTVTSRSHSQERLTNVTLDFTKIVKEYYKVIQQAITLTRLHYVV